MTRRAMLQLAALASASVAIGRQPLLRRKTTTMDVTDMYDVLIIGGSYAGLAAAMALGRSMRDVVVIDSGKPCNRFTPYSHNFLTHDGRAPSEIAEIARAQVSAYPTVHILNGTATDLRSSAVGFEVLVDEGTVIRGRKVILAMGIIDMLPDIVGFGECWGKSVLHCPYCHGYEVRGRPTAILANDGPGAEMALMVAHWAGEVTMLTNGESHLVDADLRRLHDVGVSVHPKLISEIEHQHGRVRRVRFDDGTALSFDVIYAKVPFRLHNDLSARIECDHSKEGYIVVDGMGRTTVDGVYAAGDCASRLRTVANAVGTGTAVGMQVNKDLIMEANAG